jgi:ribosome biogenesis protein Nip4
MKDPHEFARQFTEAPLTDVVNVGKRWFHDPLHLLAQTQGWDVFSIGRFIGEERKGFQPTSAFVDLVAARDERRVIVEDKAAWLFLCGRDVLMASVREEGPFSPNQLAIVADREGNVLGYGKIVAPFSRKMRNKVYVKHVLDKGEYLRRER